METLQTHEQGLVPDLTSESVWIEFMTHLYPILVRSISPRVGPENAEDITATAVLKAYEHKETMHYGNLNPWINKIFKNTYYDYIRSECSSAKYEQLKPSQEDHQTMNKQAYGNQEPLPEDIVISDENKAEGQVLAQLVLNSLPPLRKEVLVKKSQGYSYKEIAKELGVSVNDVKTKLHRARMQAIRILKEAENHT